MPGCGIYGTTRHYARRKALAYVHFRNVRGHVPNYVETFVDDGDVDMTETVRILRDEGSKACSCRITCRNSPAPRPGMRAMPTPSDT